MLRDRVEELELRVGSPDPLRWGPDTIHQRLDANTTILKEILQRLSAITEHLNIELMPYASGFHAIKTRKRRLMKQR